MRSAEHSEPGCCGGVCAEVNLRLAHGTSAEQVRLVRDKVAELSVTPPAADLSAFVRRFPRWTEPSRACLAQDRLLSAVGVPMKVYLNHVSSSLDA